MKKEILKQECDKVEQEQIEKFRAQQRKWEIERKRRMTREFNKMTPLKLPRMSYFAGTSKENSPYLRLFRYVTRKIHGSIPKGKEIDVSSVWLTQDDANSLESLVKDWMRKYHKIRSKKRVEKELCFYSLSYSPANWLDDAPKNAKNGFAYVREKTLLREPREN